MSWLGRLYLKNLALYTNKGVFVSLAISSVRSIFQSTFGTFHPNSTCSRSYVYVVHVLGNKSTSSNVV